MSWGLVAAMLSGFPTKDPYYLALDDAVMEKFPGVECRTYQMCGFDMQTESKFGKKGGGLLSKKKEIAVRQFIKDWKVSTPREIGGDAHNGLEARGRVQDDARAAANAKRHLR